MSDLEEADAELIGFDYPKGQTDQPDVKGQRIEIVCARGQQARLLVDRLDDAHGGRHQSGDVLGRRIQFDTGMMTVRRSADRSLHQCHGVGRVGQLEPVPAGPDGADPVDAPRPPL